ncbi:MAG: MFS transporter [Gallionellaceae bacterium]|jgi:ATP-dependent protease HslVU (ClpYQ) peptidase subunit
MTTIVAVRKNGIVAIAADTLTTFGNTRLPAQMDSSHDKILRIADNFVGVCGSAAHHLVLTNLLAKTPDVKLNSKEAIFETFRKLHPVLKEECFLNPKEDEEDPYESSQITALIANASGLYGIFSMREVFEYTQFWAIGSGHEFALGAMQYAYSRLENAADIAKVGVDAGIAFDKNSASPITQYTVTLFPAA